MLIPLLQGEIGVLITREQTLECPGVRGAGDPESLWTPDF